MIAIVDYGMGNIHSVNKALELCGAKTVVTNRAQDILGAEKVVLPGVGAFDDAMQELVRIGLAVVLKECVKNNKPLLGICLGMQLLFENSEEAADTKGLAILKGKVKRFPEKKGLKVPHMGWNQIRKFKKDCPLLHDISDDLFVYFCHSYYPVPDSKEVVAAITDYGIEFASFIWKENVYGAQFHPEKSQAIGLKMLKNFVLL